MGPDASIQKLPSNVRSLDLTDKNLTFIPIQFSKKSKLTTFILSKNNIHELPKNLKNLKTLVMSFNNISRVNSDIVEGLLSYPLIETLDFSYNQIKFFPSQVLNIKTLKNLTLFGNQITSLNCSSESQLVFLDLGRNKLTTPPSIPETLQTLILDCNDLQDINKISNPVKINRLCISRNKLETFTPSSVLPSLTILDISSNKLTSLPNFSKVTPHLRQLDISDNFINELPLFPRTLSEIIIRNNRLRSLPTSFSSLPCLIYADLSQNLIEELPVLPRVLQTLIVYDNNVKTVQQSSVAEMFRLYLMNNDLEEVPFFKSNALAEYYLSSNKIAHIDVKNLSRATNRIDVSNNNIVELPQDLFVVQKQPNAMKITHIFANHNRIKNLPDEFTSSEVIALNLSQNPIDELTLKLPSTIENLYLHKCNLNKLPNPSSENDDIVELVAPYNEIECIPSFNSLVVLNLSHNRLKKLPKLPNTIQFVDLSGNLIESIDELSKTDDDDDDSNLSLLESLDVSFNCLKKWPCTLRLPGLKTLKLRGNEELSGEFNVLSKNSMSSLNFLDASKTLLDFTDEAIEGIRQVLVSEDAKIVHVVKVEANDECSVEEESNEKKSDNDDEKSDNSSDEKTAESSEKTDKSTTENDESKTQTETDETAQTATENNESKDDQNEQKNDTEKVEKPSLNIENCEVDENGYLTKDPPNVFRIPSTSLISHSTHRHEREANEDSIIIFQSTFSEEPPQKPPKTSTEKIEEEEEEECKESESTTTATTKSDTHLSFAAIFDSRSSGKVASHSTTLLKELLNKKPIIFSQDFFNEICCCINDVIHNKSVFDGSSIAFAMIQNRDLFYSTVGDMRIVISNGKKGGFRILQENVEYGRRCGNKTMGQLSISKIVGDYLVYGVDISAKLNSVILKEDDKFVVLMCALVYEMLSVEQFDEIFVEYNTAVDLADAIKQTTIGAMSSDNISVVVIDVSS